MKKVKIISAVWVILIISGRCIAQQDSIPPKNDSINSVLLHDYVRKIEEIEQLRKEDSIKKAELELQLNSLKTTDNLKKEALQQQLNELNEKETRRIAQKKAQIDSLRHTASGFPVIGFFDDTLFMVYSKLASLSAKDRAEIISRRVQKLPDNFLFRPDSLRIEVAENTLDIISTTGPVMSICESDALWEDTTMTGLAEARRKIIADAVMNYRQEIRITTILKEIALALLVIFLTGLLIYYIGKLARWGAVKVIRQENRLIKGIKIKNYTLFDSKREVRAFLTLITIVKWLIYLLVIYVMLPILFGIFPWTRNFAETLFDYILNPIKKIALGLWEYLPNLITIIIIVLIFRYVLMFVKFLRGEIEKENLQLPGFYPDWANPTYQIIRVLIFAFLIVVIFPYLPGSDSPVFQGVSVFLGFLFTFGSAGSLSNIVAGLVLTYMRLFVIGDRVKIGDVTGDVIEKSLLVTRVRTIKNEIISIPNSTVMNSHTINYSSDAPDKGLIIHSTVTIGYDVPWRKMHQVLIDAALRTELILKDPCPFVLQTSLDDFYVSYQINAYIREANKQALIYSDLHQNIQDVCNENGVEILSPHYRAARDGNMTTIPADYLPEDYQSPSFQVKINPEEEKK
ncbi:MAG: mechanosensitive ion channel family protein [Bacteroidia bacterium]